MLPKAHRLKNRRDFTATYKYGIRRQGGKLTLIARKRRRSEENKGPYKQGKASIEPAPAKLPPTRIGISVSQKVSKRSVVRNKIKRQIRAAVRELLPRLSAGWDIAIVVRPGATECNYGQFLQKLEQLLAALKVLNGH
ncbi:MAG: ribonuclease P protein component [Oscillatoria sp. SIO1A7]|nr:ribonuclease P protein component [Oscillatoria sp. SIO1A7]